MKKIAIIFVLLGLIFCQSSFALVLTGQVKIETNPKNKNWKVKLEGLNTGKTEVSFSEDGGKMFFSISDSLEPIILWSPDGRYFLLPRSGPHFEFPYLSNDYYLYSPSLYDPVKRMFFSLDKKDMISEPSYYGARWAKGAGHTIEMKFFDYQGKEVSEAIKISAEEWETKYNHNTESLYVDWFFAPFKQAFLSNNIAKAKSLLDKVTCKTYAKFPREGDYCKKDVIEMMQNAKRFDGYIRLDKTVIQKKDNAYNFDLFYSGKRLACELTFSLEVSAGNHIEMSWPNTSCAG